MNRNRNDDQRDRWHNRERHDRNDRDFGDRAGDEMRSWFGDEEAERRRELDRLEAERDRGYGIDDRFGAAPRSDRWDEDRGARTWGADRGRNWGRDRYGDYGAMTDSGAGWSGGSGNRFGGEYGGRYGTGPGGRYGNAGGRYGRDHGRDDFGYSNRSERSDRWGASDWSEQSARDSGRYAGRGPSGYQRSADRITEDANEALTWAGEVDASQIQVKVEGTEVTLEGTVEDRRAKRAAEDAVERVRGVTDVHNRLRVQMNRGQASTQREDGNTRDRSEATRSGTGAGQHSE